MMALLPWRRKFDGDYFSDIHSLVVWNTTVPWLARLTTVMSYDGERSDMLAQAPCDWEWLRPYERL